MISRILSLSQLLVLSFFFVLAPCQYALASAPTGTGDVHKQAAGSVPAVNAAQHGSDSAGAGGGHGQAMEGGHGEASGGSLSGEKLKDLFWRAINFIALVVLLVKFLAKPIVSGLSGRQQQIREELADLEGRRNEAEVAYREFETRLAGMEAEMELIVQKAIAQAQTEKVRILADAERAAEDIKRQAEAAVRAELEDAKRLLKEEVAEQAAAMAEALIVKNLTPGDQIMITEQYLEKVGAVQ